MTSLAESRTRNITRAWPRYLAAHPLIPLMILAAAMSILWAMASPPWRPNDEPQHFGYVQYLSRHHAIPYPGRAGLDADMIISYDRTNFYGMVGKQETSLVPGKDVLAVAAADPPFYYALMWPAYRAAAGLSVEGQLYVVRLFSSVIFVLLVAAAYRLAGLVFPRAPYLQLGVPLLMIFHPQLLFTLTSVTNDGLVALLYTVLFCQIILMVREGLSWRRALIIAAVTGFGVLTKLSFLIAFPLIAAAVAYMFLRRRPRPDWRRLGPPAATALILPVVICGWYFLRNYLRHDSLPPIPDPTRGLNFGNVGLGRLLTGTGFDSYIIDTFLGTFSWVPLPGAVFSWFKAGLGLAGAGLAASLLAGRWRRSWRTIGPGVTAFFGSMLLIFFLAAGEYEVNVGSAQGRYLFPVIAPFWCLFLAGLAALSPPRWRARAVSIFVAGFALFGVWALMAQYMARVS